MMDRRDYLRRVGGAVSISLGPSLASGSAAAEIGSDPSLGDVENDLPIEERNRQRSEIAFASVKDIVPGTPGGNKYYCTNTSRVTYTGTIDEYLYDGALHELWLSYGGVAWETDFDGGGPRREGGIVWSDLTFEIANDKETNSFLHNKVPSSVPIIMISPTTSGSSTPPGEALDVFSTLLLGGLSKKDAIVGAGVTATDIVSKLVQDAAVPEGEDQYDGSSELYYRWDYVDLFGSRPPEIGAYYMVRWAVDEATRSELDINSVLSAEYGEPRVSFRLVSPEGTTDFKLDDMGTTNGEWIVDNNDLRQFADTGTFWGAPTIDGDAVPSDPDGDGLYEDINGNGIIEFGDVNTYFRNSDQHVVNDNTNYFDYTDDGSINLQDTLYLFEEV